MFGRPLAFSADFGGGGGGGCFAGVFLATFFEGDGFGIGFGGLGGDFFAGGAGDFFAAGAGAFFAEDGAGGTGAPFFFLLLRMSDFKDNRTSSSTTSACFDSMWSTNSTLVSVIIWQISH